MKTESMSSKIRALKPQAIWNNFADLNGVPRPSGKEEEVIAFMKAFGESLGLETLQDDTGNVVIKKPATSGMEDRKPTILQGHLDMVHQKNNDTEFDFATQGIQMYIDGDWVRARGTTLGADNGLGVAAIMAILESDDIAHPVLEALFTIDEEEGMTGAKGLDDSILEGDILLNLDTEEDDEIGIGCAGGVDVTAIRGYKEENTYADGQAFLIKVKGLYGGHSGMDIIKGLGNANKFINRLLYNAFAVTAFQLTSIEGGGLRNAIPRESEAVVVVEADKVDTFKTSFDNTKRDLKEEYASLEENLEITIEETDKPEKAMTSEETDKFLKTIYAVHNGVYRMSPEVEGLVETSNNIARVEAKAGKSEVLCLTRSSVESGKLDLVQAITAAFELGDYAVETSGDYPGWQPNPDSAILKIVDQTYQDQNDEEPKIAACHAGLECGILLDHYPSLDTISFGPTIRGAHSPDERASISSTQKFWKLLLGVLENIPEKA